MGVANVPAASGGGIKSVQRGSAAGSGTVTITAVNISKSFVTVFGTASSGTVAASFNMSSAASGNTTAVGLETIGGPSISNSTGYRPNASSDGGGATARGVTNDYQIHQWSQTVAVNAFNYNIGAGSNNLVSAVTQGYLSDSTSLVVSGACRWEVVEFN